MKKIQWYIFREFIAPLLIGTGFFTFVFVIPPLKSLVSLTLEKGIPFNITSQLFLYSLPFTGAITIPMGVLFGTLFAIGRLSVDSEITAMRSVGFSYFSLAKPVLLFGLIMTIFSFAFINFIMPESNTRYKVLYTNVVYANPSILIGNRSFEPIPNTTKQIAALNVTDDLMEEVFLYEYDKEKNEITFTYAKKGRWINNTLNSRLTSLELFEGESIRINRSNPSEVQHIDFNSFVINILNDVFDFEDLERNPREKSVFELYRDIKVGLSSALPLSPIVFIEYHKKFALPLACIIFAGIALPLGISLRRSGKGASFGLTIIVIFIYYFVMTVAETFGKRGYIDPALSTYVPLALFTVISITLSAFRLRQ